MIRLSLGTLWVLHAGNDPEALELIHDFHFSEMEQERRFCFSYDAGSDTLSLHPLEENRLMTNKNADKTDRSVADRVVDMIDLVKPTLTAARAWIKHFARGGKKGS